MGEREETGDPQLDWWRAAFDTVEARAEAAEARMKLLEEARPLAEWHEEDGPVLWWRFPVDEPPYVGSPLDLGRTYAVEMNIGDETVAGVVTLGGWPGYHTHWTPIVEPARAALAKEEGGR